MTAPMIAPMAPAAPPASAPATGLRGAGLAAAGGLVLLALAFGGWAGTAVIGGAVVALGQTVVEGSAKSVQHQDGGTVSEILVRNGDPVAEGQLLLRLDPIVASLSLDVARARLAAALAERARLLAEQAGAAEVDFALAPPPAALAARPLDLAPHQAEERRVFAARAETLRSGRARLAETLLQLDAQSEGLRAQVAAAEAQVALLDEEVARQDSLVEEGLARRSELGAILRAQADLVGQRASLQAELGRLAVARRDAELATAQAEQTFREGVATALREGAGRIEELTLEAVTRQAQLDRLEIRAPVAGVVHELQVTTLGGVVAAGATLLEIVPQDRASEFEVRVDPAAVDQVQPGQEAELVLTGLDRQDTPRLAGRVVTVSPAAVTDPQTGRSFYRVDIDVTPEELARLGPGVALVPGMPVEAFLATGDRTVLSYLLQPISAQLRRAFRE